MASKDNSPAISFFSFQDIITSITGIMFLVVIMLVLLILQQNASPSQQKSRELQKELTSMQEEVKKLRDILARVRRQAAEQKKRVDELKKLRLEQLPELKNQWINKLRSVDNAIAMLEEENKQIIQRQQEQTKLKEQTDRLIRENRKKSKELKEELAILEKELKEKDKIFKKFRKVIRFVWPQVTSKKPVLLECSGTEISVNTLEPGGKRITFSDYKKCVQYCLSLPSSDTYFVLLLKPSAFFYGEKFARELQKAQYELGREILPDEESIILGEVQK